ncbi:MAG: hypothetical protein JWL81_2292 [Verrucomicrobiales bacterium]|nr:hypothetical protein [Verrucomicrobiales bacterium]
MLPMNFSNCITLQMNMFHCSLSAAILTLSLAATAPALPPGLVVNFDAQSQEAARQKASLPPLRHRSPVDRFLEAGTQPPAVQADRAAMPAWQTDGTTAFLRYDGKDDYLLWNGPRRLSAEATIFILAAPKGNPGKFSALFSTAEAGQNDFTSGLNLDFGPEATRELSVVNSESAGAGGVFDFLEPGRNLAADLPFGGFHVFCLRSKIGPEGNEVFLDGIKLGGRMRMESHLGLDVMALGARLCSNEPDQPPFANGFFQGDLAAVLVFDRALTEPERQEVERALFARTPALNALGSGSGGHALDVLTDAPPVQMLAPGFSVSELPVTLTNRNNLRYRHDGKLVALGYDGTIHLLTDTDGDGLEDHADVFWDKETMRGPLGIALLPKDDPRGEGVFVASKGKVSLFLDKDRDGRAEEEVIVATGWKEISQNVDAVGMAVDSKDGSLYFCLGTANYANAYLLDPATGKSAFDLKSDRGTIQKVSADFKKRETVCTGVRFACALAFNPQGDLFATEQEGATWLPNGNALDELLHIEPGKHYGFPPRHPVHLPDVVDWPAVAEYGPQHQSTVGMVFNEGVNGGSAFGPDFWRGDALVCGEARGKIWRTKLAKTSAGYVGQNTLIACVGLLTVDCCVSPQGDLLIACHSGPPDWGTGPKGEGRLFKVKYTGRNLPQPVRTWASAPDEFRVAFDRELDPADWAGATTKTRMEAGRYVSAGDRFEVIRPGYQVVRDQMAAPRRSVPVQELSLSSDRRSLVVKVPRQTEPVHYALTLPLPESWHQQSAIPQHAEMDLMGGLEGAVLENIAKGREDRAVLPSVSMDVNRVLLQGSTTADWLAGQLKYVGDELRMTSLLAPVDYFQPAVQPGAKLDWTPEPQVGIWLHDGRDGKKLVGPGEDARLALWESTVERAGPDQGAFPGGPKGGTVALPLKGSMVPWTDLIRNAGPDKTPAPEIPGNWLAGRSVFFSAEAACSSCHQVRGEGIAVGPDLTNLISRDRDSVLADILKPSATINPDHTASLVKLKGGLSLTGILRSNQGDQIKLALQAGAVQVIAKADIENIEQLRTSLMPDGYAERLTPVQKDDLLKFLLTNPIEAAALERPGAPPARSLSALPEPLRAALATPADAAGKPLRLLLCAGPKDHGVGEHDYPLWLDRWSKLLRLSPGVTVDTAMTFPTTEQLAAADVAIFYSRNPGWNPAAAARLDEFTSRGGGVVYLHWAVEGGDDVLLLAERIGLATQGGVSTKYRHGPVRLDFVTRGHPITKNFPASMDIEDETYWNLQGDASRLTPLANGIEDGAPRPQLWVRELNKGRVFVCIPGHYTWTFDDPLYRLLVLRGIAWAGHQESVDRLSGLGTLGARITP